MEEVRKNREKKEWKVDREKGKIISSGERQGGREKEDKPGMRDEGEERRRKRVHREWR